MSVPRADTFGATSGATSLGNFAPGRTGGPSLLSLVLGPFKRLPPTEIRRRPVYRFPRPQDEDSIFACNGTRP